MSELVSIHAPTRGATFCFCFDADVSQQFQSTHPHGVRPVALYPGNFPTSVSIHAPTRGATGLVEKIIEAYEFQSTHPHGVRQSWYGSGSFNGDVSIHAPTRGATLMMLLIIFVLCFNPRTHTGCDLILHYFLLFRFVSIHAPTRGATIFRKMSQL